MKDDSGSIRTSIQRQIGGQVAATGERAGGGGLARDGGERWHPGALARGCARLEAVITTAAMNEAAKSAWCREHGVYPADLNKWRVSCTTALVDPQDAPASPQATRAAAKRIKELERDLLRKDRALAETAALLVLSKKVAAIFNRGEAE